MDAEGFGKLLFDLIDGYQNNDIIINPSGSEKSKVFNIENFNGTALGEYMAEQNNFWKYMMENIDRIHNEDVESMAHYGIRQGDFPEEFESVMKYVANRAELGDIDFLDYCKNITNSSDEHWNESISQLLKDYYNYGNSTSNGIFNVYIDENDPSKSVKWTRLFVRNQDAAYDFNNQYVRLQKNVDGDIYTKVRDKDAITNVLQDSSQMQYTCTQKPKIKVRLIMPKYLRRVEIEDLNRNFWVIAQSITALCAFLFSPDNPLIDLLRKLLDEIPQLWENVLYLWAQIAVMSQKPKITHIENIFFPIYNSELQAYIKYDDFEQSLRKTEKTGVDYFGAIWECIKSIKDRYLESNLVIVPEIRDQNYYHNYYSKVSYPCVIVFNRNTNKVSYYKIDKFEINLADENDNFLNNIVGVAKTDNKYYLLKRFLIKKGEETEVPEQDIPTDYIYFGGVRVIPIIKSTYNKDDKDSEIKLTELTFECYDIAQDLFTFENNTQHLATIKTTINGNGVIKILDNTNNYHKLPTENYMLTEENIKKGLYLGEVVSNFYNMPEIDYNTEFEFLSFSPSAQDELHLRMTYDTYMKNDIFNGDSTTDEEEKKTAQKYVRDKWDDYLDNNYIKSENETKPKVEFKRRSAKFLVTGISFMSETELNKPDSNGTNYQCCVFLTILLKNAKGKVFKKVCQIQAYDTQDGWPQFPMVSASVGDTVGRLSTKKLMAIKNSSRKFSDYQNKTNGDNDKLTLIHSQDMASHYISMKELKEEKQLKPLRRTCEKEEDETGKYIENNKNKQCECGGATIGTFVCSHPKIDNPQNPKLEPFYLVVLDSAMQFCFDKDEKGNMYINSEYPTEIVNTYGVAYYYRCEVDEKNDLVKAYYRDKDIPTMEEKCQYVVKASDILEGVTDKEDTESADSSSEEKDIANSEQSDSVQEGSSAGTETENIDSEFKLKHPFNTQQNRCKVIKADSNGYSHNDLLFPFGLRWNFLKGAIRKLEGGAFVDDGIEGPIDSHQLSNSTGSGESAGSGESTSSGESAEQSKSIT